MIILAELRKRINILFDGVTHVYTVNDIRDTYTDSIDNLNISDEPMKYIYRLHIRDNLLPNFMLYMPGKHILMLNERINYFV